jgi:hypothetical protein
MLQDTKANGTEMKRIEELFCTQRDGDYFAFCVR